MSVKITTQGFIGDLTGSVQGTASYAVSASYAPFDFDPATYYTKQEINDITSSLVKSSQTASWSNTTDWITRNSGSIVLSEVDPVYTADSASLKESASLASSSNYKISHMTTLHIDKGAITTVANQKYNPTGSDITIQIPTTASHLGAANATHSHAIADVAGLNAISASVVNLESEVTWIAANSGNIASATSSAHTHTNAALLNSLTNAKTGSWDEKESTDNKVTTIDSSSTDTEYPSARAVHGKFVSLSGSATIASISNGVVVIKRGVLQTAGVISNNSDTDITLHKIATSGNPSDIIVVYDGSSVNLQTVLNQIKADIDTAAASGTEYIVCDNIASEIPQGFQYYNGVTGTLVASAQTVGKIYLVLNGPSSYNQVVTTYKNNTYSWTNLGSTVVDLSGVIKTITLNGKTYGANGGSLIDLGDVITGVSGQAEINNSNKTLVHVVAVTAAADATTGTKSVTLEAQAKVATVSSGESGLADASDVKDYVDNKVVFRTWTA